MQSAGEKFTVMVVDDEPLYLEMASEQLSVDFNVITAGGVDEALQMLRHKRIDAVLADYRMAPKNGLALLKHMTDTNNPAMRVLVTANQEAAHRDEAMRGVKLDEVTCKPLPLAQFIPHLHARLQARQDA